MVQSEGDLLAIFQRYAKVKNIETGCRECHTEHGWAVFTQGSDHHVLPGGKNGHIVHGAYGIDVLALRCKNCGSIRLFDLTQILEWEAQASDAQGTSDAQPGGAIGQ